jgi:hypothetical protein
MGQIATITVGTDTFSVYALTADPLADALSFWNLRLGTTATLWAAVGTTDDDRSRALALAAEWIDRATLFTGSKTDPTQPRAWPRTGASCNGTSIATDAVPDDIARAQFYLAGQILSNATVAESSGQGSNVKRAKAGSAEVEFFTPTIGGAADIRLPQVAQDFLVCYIGASDGFGPSTSGDTSSSAFCDNDFTRSDGFS